MSDVVAGPPSRLAGRTRSAPVALARPDALRDLLFFAVVFTVTYARLQWDIAGDVSLADFITLAFLGLLALEWVPGSRMRIQRTTGVVILFFVAYKYQGILVATAVAIVASVGQVLWLLLKGKKVQLTPTEYRLLYHLVSNPGRILSHETLLAKVWGYEYREEEHYVRLYVTYLRQKIEPDPSHPKYILTERGLGYRFVDYRDRAESAQPTAGTSAGEPGTK